MAENKKSVLLYCDIIHTVEELDDSDAGLLFKHYLRYINDQNPEPPSKLIKIVFEPIKQNLKRDLKKWEAKSVKNSESAKKRWSERNEENANASERTKRNANHADKDTVTVIDTVKVTVTDNDIKNNNIDEDQNTTSENPKANPDKKTPSVNPLPPTKPVQSNLERFKETVTDQESAVKYLKGLNRALTIKRILQLAESFNIAHTEEHPVSNYENWKKYFRYFLNNHREPKMPENAQGQAYKPYNPNV